MSQLQIKYTKRGAHISDMSTSASPSITVFPAPAGMKKLSPADTSSEDPPQDTVVRFAAVKSRELNELRSVSNTTALSASVFKRLTLK